MRWIVLHVVLALLFAGVAQAGSFRSDLPENPDPNAFYLFYLHGAIVEEQGDGASHPQYGSYQYSAIAKRFADLGFEVIGEVRPQGTGKGQYARLIAMNIQRLLDAGVPGKHITVAGHSKGGSITMITSTFVSQPDIGYVMMASCGAGQFARSYAKFLQKSAPKMSGRLLSLYDRSDRIAGTCKEAFKIASRKGHITAAEEVAFSTGLGHGLFYKARADWMGEVVKWAQSEAP